MNTRLIISLLCAGALAFACGPRSHSEAPAAIVSAQPAQTVTPVAPAGERVARTSKNSKAPAEVKLDSRLKVDVAKQEVRFALDVRNVGKKHAELDFPNGQSYDFVVVDSVGREVWHWSSSRMFTSAMQNKQLGAGEAMEVSEAWQPPAAAGRYVAIATLKSSNYPVEQRAEFVVK
ncbi:MAG: BsuPI-related putative proteinase inhibitor [Gemmatimonadaceae bacterium]